MMAWYVDDYGDGDDYNRLGVDGSYDPDPDGILDEEDRIASATSGQYYWSFGMPGLSSGEGWETSALGAPEDVAYFASIPYNEGAGFANIALNLVQNPNGPQLAREVSSSYGDDVDFGVTANFVGMGDRVTPMNLFDNFDGKLKPIPEPATMLLLGSGLVGMAGFGRKKFFKKG
jgi:hypothetical protein